MGTGRLWLAKRAQGVLDSGRDMRQALASSQTTLQRTLELTQTGSWEWDIATNTVRWSDNLGPIHGLPAGSEPPDYESFLALIHPEDRDTISAAVEGALGRGEGYELELRSAPRDGEVDWVLTQASVLANPDGTPARIVGLTRNITERKLREERAAMLADASQLLAQFAGEDVDLSRLAALVVERLADRCEIRIVGEAGVESFAVARTESDDLVQTDELRLFDSESPPSASALYADVGALDVDASVDAARLTGIGVRSLVVAPLRAGDLVLGAIAVAAGAGRRRYQPGDASLVDELADRIALAADSARLRRLTEETRREADRAAEQARRLAGVTAGLAAAATTTEIADVIVNVGIPALSATTGILGVLEDPDELRFVRSVGYGDVFPDRLAVDAPWPIATAVRERRVVELRDLRERRAAYSVPDEIWEASGQGTLVAVPLLVHDRPVGALGFTRERSASLTDEELQLVETLARQAAHALDRASLYEADQRARMQAEGLQRVTSAVAAASTMEEVAEAVASEAGAVLAVDGVTVVLAPSADAEAGKVLASEGAVVAHAMSEPTVDLRGRTITAAAIRSGQAIFVERAAELERDWPASAAVARRLGVTSIACMPFRVGGKRGAVSVVAADARRFLPEERRFLDLLARTCEQGLLRAELFEAERDARRRSDVLQGLAAALSGAVTPSDVGEAYLEHALRYFAAGSGALALADPSGTTLDVIALGGAGLTRAQWLHSLPVDEAYIVATAYRESREVTVSTRAEFERVLPKSAERFRPHGQAAYGGPLVVGSETIGAYGLVFERQRAITGDETQLLTTMADLCAQAIERARLYETEHRVAHRLQRALLPPRIVDHADVEVAAFYRAGAESMEIGGDWYDTFGLADGRIGIAVGDVVGQGIEAGAAMGRLRSALAAYALDAHEPASVIERLSRFAATPGGVDFATACYAVLDPGTGDLSYCSAGHPPMLVVDAGGEARWLVDGRSQPLYGGVDYVARAASDRLEPGSLLLAFSDGLVERRGEHIDAGLARLAEAARELRELPLEALCGRLVEMLSAPGGNADDTVMVAVRMAPVTSRTFREVFPARPEELRRIRAAARAWLDESEVPAPRRADIVLALGEACSNAVEHAYAGREDGDVEVELRSGPNGVVLRVRDAGSWRPERERTDRGRGYGIMRELGEEVAVQASSEGTEVTVVFPVAVEAHA